MKGVARHAVVVLAALCCLAGGASAATIQDVVNSVSQSQYTAYLSDPNFLYTHNGNDRGFATSGSTRYPRADHDPARDNIRDEFTALGLTAGLDPFSFVKNSVTYAGCNNVVGVKTGSVRPDDMYIVGAHYDSVNNPGADDNASGVAGVLEAARVLSQYDFEATLIFIAFDAEELGLHGSKHYASDQSEDNILGMISLDMIAYNPAGADQDKARIYGRTASNTIKNALASALSTYGGIPATIGGQLSASDHDPFEVAGFPACLLIEYKYSSNPRYHGSADSVDTSGYIDYPYATDMVRGTVGYLATAAVLVPEPATALAMGVAALVLVLRRRGGSR